MTTDLEGTEIVGKFDEQARTHLRAYQPGVGARRRLARQPGDHDRLHQRCTLRRPRRSDPARALPRWPLPLQRPLDHLRLRAPEHRDRNTGRGSHLGEIGVPIRSV